ncbi:MAG: hypothetical protein KGI54_09445 [Pseudomonadota bacterium]|nr:hypothetical protein [Pseudomonadota bacterium]
MGEYARSARGKLVSTGALMAVALPFEPQVVELINYTAAATNTGGLIPYTTWHFEMGQGQAVNQIVETSGTSPTNSYLTNAVLTAGGISTFSAGLSLQFGAQIPIQAITKASAAVVTANGHGYVTGDVVLLEGLYQSPTTGMPQISGIPFVVTVSDANTFSIPWNTNQSDYTALSGTPVPGAFVRQIIYPFLYAPGVSNITSLTLGTTTTVVTTAPHNLSVGSEVGFRISPLWGTVQLNSPQNFRIPGSPVYGYVMAVTDATTVVVKLNSTNFTPFNTNIPIANVPGLTPPQMIAVGDVNSGGTPYSGGALYPSPVVNGVSTINGPAILGSFVNNTASGFVIGAGVAGSIGDDIYWRAYLYDYSIS